MEQGGKRIVMNGDAYVHRQPDANNDLLDVRSQQLIILPDEDVVYTDLPAEVLKGRSRMNGTGMHYNNRPASCRSQHRPTWKSPAAKASSSAAPRFQPQQYRPEEAMTDLRIRLAPTTRLIGAALLAAAALAPRPTRRTPRPSRRPAGRARRRTQHADPVRHAALRRREEAERVHRQRQHDARVDDADLRHAGNARGRQGNQYGTATANKGKVVTIRQERPENFELIEGKGLRAEYDGTNSTFDLIGRPWWCATFCGKPFDTIRGERVRYNEKSGTYEAHGGPNSAAAGGRCARWPSPAPRRTPPSPNAASSRPRRRGAKRLPATHPPPRMNPPSVQTL